MYHDILILGGARTAMAVARRIAILVGNPDAQ
jgi:hypothetical protein